MRKYELILEDENFNRLSFVNEDLYRLSSFMEVAMGHSKKPLKAMITIVPEESKEVTEDDNL
jgi:hypothetical protein